MKGIILAGGTGSRLYPITKSVSKQLMPIYDKPMIYYPLSILMLAGIQEVLIISTPEDLPRFQKLLGDGSEIGMNFCYISQALPSGIADAFNIGRDFIGKDNVSLILGDNIYYGQGMTSLLENAVSITSSNNACVFGYHVEDPERYGVVEFDSASRALSIEEKPLSPKSNYAVTGLYFYPNDIVDKALELTPSKRDELEISTINQMYLKEDRLKVEIMGRGIAWLDTGTHESLLHAATFVEKIEKRQGLKIACIEEIAFERGYISKEQLEILAHPLIKNQYGKYLMSRANKKL
ncbi:MAG: glucose-1-phosphate thymidylyltransferase RfbA [Candidatus Neomarinimicrobiota bacterium]|nr:glucose-1-phosphate thymidylyltransferase RfbA [Candidatus Neomarinimicrobiota bacterium]